MIRILLGLAIALAGYFGPWATDFRPGASPAAIAAVDGRDFAAPTIACLLDGEMPSARGCAPAAGLAGQAITAAIVLGGLAALLNVAGLLPLVGRLTSLATMIAGAAAVVAFVVVARQLLMSDIASIADLRWGAYASLLFGLASLTVGWAGLSGE